MANYFVSYHFKNDKGSGFGNYTGVEVDCDKLTSEVIDEMTKWISEKQDASIVILNIIKLDKE